MKKVEAIKYLRRAEKSGYVAYHSGIVVTDVEKRFAGNTTGNNWGINIDGDGSESRPFGCPQIIWDADEAERIFPSRKPNYYSISYKKANGQEGILTVKARNEKEAIANAIDNCYTGSDFKVIGLTEPTKDTVKGGGSHRMN